MASQTISVGNHECDWDEIMDACEEHGLRPRKNKDGKFNYWVTLEIGITEITWFIKWSLKDDWQSYWLERDELSQQSGGFTALNAGRLNGSTCEVATPQKHSETMRGIKL